MDKWTRTSKARKLSQREMDDNYAIARGNCSFKRMRERARSDSQQREADARDAQRQQKAASYKGATARVIWTTQNQDRLIRVFA